MNPFNTVFLAVKKYCGDTDFIEDVRCFEAVAIETNISLDRLDMYLDILQDLELIKYSRAKSFIQITALGKQKKELFSA